MMIRNKKIVIGVIVIAVIALAGFFGAQYLGMKKNQPATSQPTTQNNKTTSNQPTIGNVKIDTKTSGLSVSLQNTCAYRCGDGICQTSDPSCKPGDSSCICPETPQNCLQDCKSK